MKKLNQNTVYYAIVLAVVVLSCGPSSEKKQQMDDLKAKVVSVHDSAMAKMNNIMLLEKQLQEAKADTLTDSLKVVAIDKVYANLKTSEENMMSWMQDFSAKFPDGTLMGGNEHEGHNEPAGGEDQMKEMDFDTMYKALEEELSKIQKVSTDIDAAISEGQSVLKGEA